MRIATKLNAGMLLVIAASVAANTVALNTIVAPKFDEVEMALAQARHERVVVALDVMADKVRAAAQDYGYWDDTYDFVKGDKESRFIEENFSPADATLQGLGVNGFVFSAPDGTNLFAKAYDGEAKEYLPELEQELAALGYRHPYLDRGGDAAAISGIVGSSRGPLLVAAAPILRSDHSGPAAGMVVVASFLKAPVVQRLTGVPFAFEPLAGAHKSPQDRPAVRVLADHIETASVLTDIKGQALAALRTSTPRDASHVGSAAVRSAALLMLGAAAVAGLALWLMTRRIVVDRLARLREHFATAGSTGQLRLANPDPSSDEIGQLSRAFDTMAGQVDSLQNALAESSYQAGLAEWAAGTLHNVRNGLAPVATFAWEIRKSLDPAWLANLGRAVAEGRAAEVDPPRKADLALYIEASALRFADAGSRVRGLTERIDESNRAVVDIVSQFEEHARREMRIEPVDLAVLAADVARTPLRTTGGAIEIVLPTSGARALANRAVLRQVVSNVLINAAESIEAAGRPGIIRFEIAREGLEGDRLMLSITDNGEGLGEEQLATIFQLGVSTRKSRRGGLGLHWCAIAMKLLGGTIRAESIGPGKGATFVLGLPAAIATAVEAA